MLNRSIFTFRRMIGFGILGSTIIACAVIAAHTTPRNPEWRVGLYVLSYTGGPEPFEVNFLPGTPPSQRIETYAGQDLQVTIGRDTIVVDPNTIVTIGDDDPETSIPHVELTSGAILVEASNTHEFTVRTPDLIARVTGARLQFSASNIGSRIAVLAGADAEVTSLATGKRQTVAARNFATIKRAEVN